jgi:hypothetical protein
MPDDPAVEAATQPLPKARTADPPRRVGHAVAAADARPGAADAERPAGRAPDRPVQQHRPPRLDVEGES